MNSTDSNAATTLATLRRGERATVLKIEKSDSRLVAKLAARGLVPGAEVGVVRSGDPLLLAIDDARWAFDRREASAVHVDIIPGRARPRRLLDRILRR
jgi:Fe2+ transport system protein FeoA